MALFGRDLSDEKAMSGALLLAQGLVSLSSVGGFMKGVAEAGRGKRRV